MATQSNPELYEKLSVIKSVPAVNYKRMVKDIDNLVNNDWCAEMEMTYKMPGAKPITQEDAIEMLDTILKVYSISHQRTCSAHGAKYRLSQRLSKTGADDE